MTWHPFIDDAHASVVELTEWVESLAPFAQDFVLGEIAALLETAAEGRIVDGGEVRLKPVRLDPELFELRWTLLSKKVRQYHGEPPRYPDLLISVHRHIKDISGNKAANNAAQQAHIQLAHDRYRP